MLWLAVGVLVLLGCNAAPEWVRSCKDTPKSQGNEVLACGSASIADADADFATTLARTRALDRLADFVRHAQNKGSRSKEVTAIQETKVRATWVGQQRVFVLVAMDKERVLKTPVGVVKESVTPGAPPQPPVPTSGAKSATPPVGVGKPADAGVSKPIKPTRPVVVPAEALPQKPGTPP